MKDERVREAYATDEIDLFRGVAAQMAITMQNSKLYERMKERDRLAVLGQMAAGLAHEIRNPLGAIKGAAQLLAARRRRRPRRPAEAREFLGIIVEEVDRLNRVVLAVPRLRAALSRRAAAARRQRGGAQVGAAGDAAAAAGPGDTAEVAPPVEVSLQLADDLPRARADAEQLRQVFLNLAINAVQAMPAGGKLTISTALRKGGRRGGAGAVPRGALSRHRRRHRRAPS